MTYGSDDKNTEVIKWEDIVESHDYQRPDKAKHKEKDDLQKQVLSLDSVVGIIVAQIKHIL